MKTFLSRVYMCGEATYVHLRRDGLLADLRYNDLCIGVDR